MSTGLANHGLLSSEGVRENAIDVGISVVGASTILVSVVQHRTEIVQVRITDRHGRTNLNDLVEYIRDKNYQHVDDLRFILDYHVGTGKEWVHMRCLHVYGVPNVVAGIMKILATITI